MARRTSAAAEAAAQAASEAARTLQQRGQEVKAEREPKSEHLPAPDKEEAPQISNDRIRELMDGNPRDKIMEELEKASLERQGIKEEPKEEPKAEAPKEPEKPAEPSVEAATATEATPVAAEAPAVPEAAKTVRVKVDGEEFDAPQEEIDAYGGVKAYQIAKAGENRLKKANETVAESKRLTAQLFELLQKKQEPVTPQVTDDEFIKSKAAQIRFGTEEEFTAALKEILQRGAPKPVDQNAIISQALVAIDRKQATADFGKQFPEIIANPLLMRLAVSLEQEEIAKSQKAGQPIDYRNLYSRIGNQVRSVVPQRQSQPPTTQTTSGTPSQASEKEARKASITVLPTASARAELPKEEKEPTRTDIINEMKRERGQLG